MKLGCDKISMEDGLLYFHIACSAGDRTEPLAVSRRLYFIITPIKPRPTADLLLLSQGCGQSGSAPSLLAPSRGQAKTNGPMEFPLSRNRYNHLQKVIGRFCDHVTAPHTSRILPGSYSVNIHPSHA
jgi:hypothetical protein